MSLWGFSPNGLIFWLIFAPWLLIFMLIITVASYVSLSGAHLTEGYLIFYRGLAVLWQIFGWGGWLWSIIDNAIRPSNYFEEYRPVKS